MKHAIVDIDFSDLVLYAGSWPIKFPGFVEENYGHNDDILFYEMTKIIWVKTHCSASVPAFTFNLHWLRKKKPEVKSYIFTSTFDIQILSENCEKHCDTMW